MQDSWMFPQRQFLKPEKLCGKSIHDYNLTEGNKNEFLNWLKWKMEKEDAEEERKISMGTKRPGSLQKLQQKNLLIEMLLKLQKCKGRMIDLKPAIKKLRKLGF
jgi:hypothetical protein